MRNGRIINGATILRSINESESATERRKVLRTCVKFINTTVRKKGHLIIRRKHFGESEILREARETVSNVSRN